VTLQTPCCLCWT